MANTVSPVSDLETYENGEKETFCCGGKKRCPSAECLSDGSVRVADVDQSAAPIVFSPEQASQLRAWLEKRGF